MRKIKFRGKTLDGRWIYGDLWHRPYAKDCVTIVSFMEDTGTTGGLEVIPETVGQYTGLKDKNGIEIYEGDIVENVVDGLRDTLEELIETYDETVGKLLHARDVLRGLLYDIEAVKEFVENEKAKEG